MMMTDWSDPTSNPLADINEDGKVVDMIALPVDADGMPT